MSNPLNPAAPKSARELSLEAKEKLSKEPTNLQKKIEARKCPRTKSVGLCEFGNHNKQFNINTISNW